jgi:hypothetical protein
MHRVRQELHRPVMWLIPLVVLAIQLVGSIGPRHRAGHALHWAPLNWFGYLLLVAGPVVLLLRTVYPYAVLLRSWRSRSPTSRQDSDTARSSSRW